MESVADRVRREQRERLRVLSAAERVALALALGRRDLATFRRAQRALLTLEEARRLLRCQRQTGRRPSRCHDSLTA